MPKLEIKRTSELTRKQVSERLIALGKALASGSEVELGSGGDSITVEVADRVEFELEIEVDGDETEIEIEISWRDGASATAHSGGAEEPAAEPTAAPKKAATRRPRKAASK
ncbi:amphi-Trp domain-containing protein [Williamsia limnetica]|uniref:Amphi-Trp domain-containing protein n=1 Tax=Williamsia limnetica TaxID=882452 RepID=A0A318RJ03_WILLI|nr:amphi-Trp domain-containing protein [Williamsia limnetica]PYE17502.1 amphi-Trp domain-containing protein [Williamsia limnetica]